jgi:hypothetical protein
MLNAVDGRLAVQDKKFQARFDAIDRPFDPKTRNSKRVLTLSTGVFDKLEQR